MPEPTIRILSTRPLATTLLDQGKAHGMIIDALSFIATEPVIDETLGRRIRELSTQPLVAVFTSMNAVEAATRHLASSIAPSWQVFCIGAATGQLIRDHFGEDRIAGTANSASELANVLIQRNTLTTGVPAGGLINKANGSPPIREVFFFCGDQRRDELPDQLRQASIKVNELIVYRTLPTPHTIETVYDGIVFFSPSAVHSFFTRNTVPPATILFAIGQTTADCIRGYTPNKTILSGIPEKETLIRQVIDYFQTNNIYY